MPTGTAHFTAGVWTRDLFERSVKYTMELDQQGQPQEMRMATIILEGDVRVKIKAWNQNFCVVRYGKKHRKEMTLPRRFMNFRYAKEKVRAV